MSSEQDAVERLKERRAASDENAKLPDSNYVSREVYNLALDDAIQALEASQQEVERLRGELEAILGGDWDLQAAEETDD